MGSCLSYLVVGGLLTLLGFLAIPSLIDQGRELADDFPRIYDDLSVDVENLVDNFGLTVDLPDYEKLRLDIEESGGDFFSEQFGRITDITLSLLESLFLLLIAPVVAFYVLLDLPTLRRKMMELIPERHRDETRHVVDPPRHCGGRLPAGPGPRGSHPGGDDVGRVLGHRPARSGC